MKIIILGAGQVGGTLAEHLASEANDITVVDTDGERLRDLGDRLDIRTVQGRLAADGAAPGRCRRRRHAGGRDQQRRDQHGRLPGGPHLFHTPTKIARVREAAYLTRAELFDNERSRWTC
jgi:trk system potassium uptake protein TrkA